MTTPDWLRRIPVAHRGLHDAAAGVPENSLSAFRAAVDEGYAIELDVRLARDGVAMVFHDAKLERMCGRPERMGDLDSASLRRIALQSGDETIPMLEDVLALVAGRVPMLIEIKNYGTDPVGPLESATVADLADYTGALAVQSFSPLTVEWFRTNAPHLVRGQIATAPSEMTDLDDAQKQMLAQMLDHGFGAPQFIAYDVRHLPSPLTTRARAQGLPVLTWTVRDDAALARARAHADNIIFERPVVP